MSLEHPGIAAAVKSLLAVAKENPWWEFTGEDIAAMMNLPANTVAMLKRADKSPFVGGRARPERVAAFFLENAGWSPSAER